jgi:lambda family phage portal protein
MKFSFKLEREPLISLGLNAPREKQAPAKKSKRNVSRSYRAAKIDRLTVDWSAVATSANYDLRIGLRILRARSRNLAKNNDYVKRFLSMVRSNVVGPHGIKLQSRAANSNGELTAPLNRRIEEAWEEWIEPENASASTKLGFRDQLLLAVNSMARDGEFLIREIVADNEFGYALQFYDVNWLDENFNELLSNGNRVIMSVEVNKYGKPVAYWFTPPRYAHLFPENTPVEQRTRIPAEEVIHKFLIFEDEQQTRGCPWTHTAMFRLNTHGNYEEAELVAARVGASKLDYLVPPKDEDDFADDDDDFEAEDAGKIDLPQTMEPGVIEVLPPGYDVKSPNRDHPNANYEGFNKAVLRGVASGLDISYFSLANDLEAVNFSSARIGLLEERDMWKGLQGYVIQHVCRRVYRNWLKSAQLTGKIQLRPHEIERVSTPGWRARGWTWVDPVKDVQATVMAVNNGLATRTDAVAEQGRDFDELTTTLQHEQKMLDEKGIRLISADKVPNVKSEENPEAEPSDDVSQK